MRWKKVTLVGVGLLGGSLGLALKRRGLAGSVTGYVRRAASVRECQETGAVDEATLDLRRAVDGADLVVFCTPVAQMSGLAETMVQSLARGCVVTDVGSVKTDVVRKLEPIVRAAGGHFIGSHPMAGAEKTGVAASRADLYENAICVVTPEADSNRRALRRVEWFWRSLGCRVLKLTPEVHDRLVSRSSHLPHVLATTLVNFVLRAGAHRHQAALCANGFRDVTRIASGSPEMWRDIALANGKNIDLALETFIADLRAFQNLLKAKDGAGINRFFEHARNRRGRWLATARGASPE